MDTLSLLALALALAMDAFAVALAAGVNIRPLSFRPCFRLSFHFGLFQALMPIIGWLAGLSLRSFVQSISHWIAFALLAAIGSHMIFEALQPDKEEKNSVDPSKGFTMVGLSVATSIDALATGLIFVSYPGTILTAMLAIGLTTVFFAFAGMFIGGRFGKGIRLNIEMLGGIILIAIGTKILLQHLGNGG